MQCSLFRLLAECGREMDRQLTFTLDYEEEEQLTTVLHFRSPVLVEYTMEDIPFYGKRAEIIVKV